MKSFLILTITIILYYISVCRRFKKYKKLRTPKSCFEADPCDNGKFCCTLDDPSVYICQAECQPFASCISQCGRLDLVCAPEKLTDQTGNFKNGPKKCQNVEENKDNLMKNNNGKPIKFNDNEKKKK